MICWIFGHRYTPFYDPGHLPESVAMFCMRCGKKITVTTPNANVPQQAGGTHTTYR